MIHLEQVSVRYPGQATPSLLVPALTIVEGELVLVAGPTGSGKSSLLGTLNGLVPHFTGGTLAGDVIIDGRNTRDYRPRDLADVVALVRQNPASSFVTDTVEEEIAYGMETLGVGPNIMRRRVEETLDLLGLAEVRYRLLRELSGGQQQRVAIAAVLAAGPSILVLDEPTSALDPVAAEEVLSALQRLVHDLSLTVVLAEHRLERVIHHADAIVLIEDGQVSPSMTPAAAMAHSAVCPPVIDLGRWAGWDPLPLSVRDARRRAWELREALDARRAEPARSGRSAATSPDRPSPATGESAPSPPDATSRLTGRTWPFARQGGRARRNRPTPASRHPHEATLRAVTVRLAGHDALSQLSLEFRRGEICAVMGRNGAGKSTLLWTVAGHLRPAEGQVRVGADDPAELAPQARVGVVGMVPQDPANVLYADRVQEECADSDVEAGLTPGTTESLLHALTGPLDPQAHPRDLSEGQRLGLALAIIVARRPGFILLDEPTRGLDYAAKANLVRLLRELAAADHAVVMATHDVELAAEVADRVVLLADGRLVADDPSPQVLANSTAYAPQIARVLHPLPLLTLGAVQSAMGPDYPAPAPTTGPGPGGTR